MPPHEGPEKRTLTGPKMKPVTKTHMSIAKKKTPNVDHPPLARGLKVLFRSTDRFFWRYLFFLVTSNRLRNVILKAN